MRELAIGNTCLKTNIQRSGQVVIIEPQGQIRFQIVESSSKFKHPHKYWIPVLDRLKRYQIEHFDPFKARVLTYNWFIT